MYYGSATLDLKFVDEPPRVFMPKVVLLEYIPNTIILGDIMAYPELPKSIPPYLAKSIETTVNSFGTLGVIHSDINPGNILFSPRNNPKRAIIIDFGNSYFAEGEMD